jgi:hypothetical protein
MSRSLLHSTLTERLQRLSLQLGSYGLACVLVLPTASWAFAAEPTLPESTMRYFNTLKNRRWFSLAEHYGLQRLADPTLEDELRWPLTLEVVAVLVDHAGQTAPSANRVDLLEKSAELLQQNGLADSASRRLRVQLELARIAIASTQGALDDWLANGGDATFPQQLAAANQRWAECEEVAAKTNSGPQKLDRQLRQVYEEIRLLLAASLLDAADLGESALTSATRAEQSGWLLQAAKLLKGSVGADRDTRMTATHQLLQLRLARLRGEYASAEGTSDQLQKPDRELGPPEKDWLASERVALLQATQKWLEGAKVFAEFRKSGGTPSGRLWGLHANTLDELANLARLQSRLSLADELQAEADKASLACQQLGPPRYWYALNRKREQRQVLGDVSATDRAVLLNCLLLIQQKNWVAAAAGLESLTKANRSGNVQRLRQLYVDGLIGEQRWQEAAQGLETVAAQATTAEEALAASVQRIRCLGKSLEQTTTVETAARYRLALEAVLASSAASRARSGLASENSELWEIHYRYGCLLLANRQGGQARAYLSPIPPDSTFYEPAALALVRSLVIGDWDIAAALKITAPMITRILESGRPGNAITAELAITLLETDDTQTFLTDDQRTSLLLWLENHVPEAADLAWPNGLLGRIEPLRLTGLVSRGKWQEAKEALSTSTPPAETQLRQLLLVAYGRLIAHREERSIAQPFAQVLISVAESRFGQIDSPQSGMLALSTARFCYLMSQPAHGLALLERIEPHASPAEIDAIIELLIDQQRISDTPVYAAWQLVLKLSEQRETQLPQGSDQWLAIRYHRVQSLAGLSKPVEAKKLVDITRVVYGKKMTPATKTQWDELAAELQKGK